MGEHMSAEMIMPGSGLSNCLFSYFRRNTIALNLDATQRFNYFPASPMCSISWVFSGESQLIDFDTPQNAAMSGHAISQLSFSGPQTNPVLSWNPASVHALTLAIYPDAWQALGGADLTRFVNTTVPLEEAFQSDTQGGVVLALCQNLLRSEGALSDIKAFEAELLPIWQAQTSKGLPLVDSLNGWIKQLAFKAMTSPGGQSVRQGQRRIRQWTGQSQRELEAYARNEELFALVVSRSEPDAQNLSELALDAGYADQSHMGRQVRKITGISPAKINRLIARHEAFWCYRLLGTRY